MTFDTSLATVIEQLVPHTDKLLAIEYDGRCALPGYHVTEVKAGSFVTLDCGGEADSWRETILQVEDVAAQNGEKSMTAGKFCTILRRSGAELQLDFDARLTFEIGGPGEPMRVFDVASVSVDDAAATIRLAARDALCKPRHRAAAAKAGERLRSTQTTGGSCCL